MRESLARAYHDGMPSKPKAKRYFNWGLAIGYVIGVLFAGVCFRIAWTIEPARWWLNVAVCLFGYGFGWNVGMLLSPKGVKEQREFVTYGKAIVAFFGGFLIAKLDAALGGNALKNVIADPVAVTRLLLFVITFLVNTVAELVRQRLRERYSHL